MKDALSCRKSMHMRHSPVFFLTNRWGRCAKYVARWDLPRSVRLPVRRSPSAWPDASGSSFASMACHPSAESYASRCVRPPANPRRVLALTTRNHSATDAERWPLCLLCEGLPCVSPLRATLRPQMSSSTIRVDLSFPLWQRLPIPPTGRFKPLSVPPPLSSIFPLCHSVECFSSTRNRLGTSWALSDSVRGAAFFSKLRSWSCECPGIDCSRHHPSANLHCYEDSITVHL